MKVGVLAPPGVGLVDRPEPVAGPGEILVRLAACGVCGTDLEKVRGNYGGKGILGHEPVGAVSALGDGVTGYSVGDRVFVHHHVPCYACETCRRGDLTYCPEYGRSNLDPGGFAETFRVPEANVRRGAVLPLDASVDWDVGTLLEPAACARTALRRVDFAPADSVIVLGLGPVGLLYGALAGALGARSVAGADLAARRREAGLRFGLSITVDPRTGSTAEQALRESAGPDGADLVVVAAGAPAAIAMGARLVRRGGTLNLFGLPEPGSRLDHDLQALYLRGIRVLPTYATTERDIADLHRLLASGHLRLDGLVTDRLPLERISEAFDRAGRPEAGLKTVVTGPAYAGG